MTNIVQVPAFVPRQRYTFSFKFTVHGAHSVGKASLVRRYVSDATYELLNGDTYNMYRPMQRTHVKLGRNTILLNFSHNHKYIGELPATPVRGTAMFVVFDLCRQSTFTDAQRLLSMYQRNYAKSIHVLVGNKLDKESERQVLHDVAWDFARDNGAHYFEVSSRSRYEINNMMVLIAEEVFERILQGRLEELSDVEAGSYPVIKFNLCEKLRKMVGNKRAFSDIMVRCLK
jgi:GTPase SAR1 family protein